MIKSVNADNLGDILPLIREYQTFYQVTDIDDERNQTFFSQFGTDNPLGCQFAYYTKDESGHTTAVAFATVYFTYASSITAKVAVLNDLYVMKSHQCKGIARQLIEHCHDYALKNGAKRLQWLTQHDNHTAQTLYDRLDIQKSEWVFYTYD